MNPTDHARAMRGNAEALAEIATRIGQHLVETAVWDDQRSRCTWLGRRDIQDAEIAAYSERAAALSPELYSGTAGIALFLDALYRATGNMAFAETARASWNRSLHYLRTHDFPASAISFYAGELGLLYVGYRLAESGAADTACIEPALAWLCGRVEEGLATRHSLDVIGGNAGAIGPLLALARRERLPGLRRTAAECANEILQLAHWKDDICLWAAPKIHGVELDKPPLTGFSHGASGIAVALLVASRETGREDYLRHARGAFAFEEQLFNADEGNWVDTRYPHFRRDGKICGTYRRAWCHGAPGIALAHMAARRLDPDNAWFHEQRLATAIETTRQIWHEKLQTHDHDLTLCHGAFGLSDILLSHAMEDDPDAIPDLQAQVLHVLGAYTSPANLPSGLVRGGYTPSLLIGLSGIGLHLLRLAGTGAAPSVLLVEPGLP